MSFENSRPSALLKVMSIFWFSFTKNWCLTKLNLLEAASKEYLIVLFQKYPTSIILFIQQITSLNSIRGFVCWLVCQLVCQLVRRSVTVTCFFSLCKTTWKWPKIIRKFFTRHKSTPPIKTSMYVKVSNCSCIVVTLRNLFILIFSCDSQFYKRLCPSVHWSFHPSMGNTFFFDQP